MKITPQPQPWDQYEECKCGHKLTQHDRSYWRFPCRVKSCPCDHYQMDDDD